MASRVTVGINIDRKALAKELKSSRGATGRTLAAFAGVVTHEINDTFRDHAGGPWWRVKSTMFDGGAFGASFTTVVRSSRPHVIRAKNAPALHFQFPDGKWFWGQQVNHPGSSPPEHLVQRGVDRALKKKSLSFFKPRK